MWLSMAPLLNADGAMRVLDCDSTQGTYILDDRGQPLRVRSAWVQKEDRLTFGKVTLAILDILQDIETETSQVESMPGGGAQSIPSINRRGAALSSTPGARVVEAMPMAEHREPMLRPTLHHAPLIFVSFLLAILAITNPSLSDYRQFVDQEIKRMAEAQDNGLAMGLTMLISGFASDLLINKTIRTNYFIMSTYETSFDQAKRLYSVGVFNNFYIVEDPRKGTPIPH
jgi:hypothetical protein